MAGQVGVQAGPGRGPGPALGPVRLGAAGNEQGPDASKGPMPAPVIARPPPSSTDRAAETTDCGTAALPGAAVPVRVPRAVFIGSHVAGRHVVASGPGPWRAAH